MASWIKLTGGYKPAVGEELLATFADYGDGIGTVYQCTGVTDNEFSIISIRHISIDNVQVLSGDKQNKFTIPYDMIPIINLHRKFRMGFDQPPKQGDE